MLAAVAGMALSGGVATAQQPSRAEEMAYLPPYCNYTQGYPGTAQPGAYQSYLTRYGAAWSHMHHYCWALGEIVRADRMNTPPAVKRGLIGSALGNIEYVLQRSEAGFPCRPEMLSRKARLLMRTGDANKALETAQRLRDEAPTLADGYILMADILTKGGRPEEAQRVLIDAEAQVADKERLARLRSAFLDK
jgi:tetratricopeptide (TPR) repeat protein